MNGSFTHIKPIGLFVVIGNLVIRLKSFAAGLRSRRRLSG